MCEYQSIRLFYFENVGQNDDVRKVRYTNQISKAIHLFKAVGTKFEFSKKLNSNFIKPAHK